MGTLRPSTDPAADQARTRLPPGELGSAVTDLLVALEAAALAMTMPEDAPRGHRPDDAAASDEAADRRRRIASGFRSFFWSTAAAAGSGAALHGLFADPRNPVRRMLWRASMAAIGIAALSGWRTGAVIALQPSAASAVDRVATAAHAAYVAWVLSREPRFVAAISAYLPSTVFLAWALTRRLDGPGERDAAAVGLVAIAITGSAAAIQVGRIRLHPHFDSNATYHTVQALGLLAFAASARRFVRAGQPRR